MWEKSVYVQKCKYLCESKVRVYKVPGRFSGKKQSELCTGDQSCHWDDWPSVAL